MDIEQRKCRLPEENNLDVYKYYSYSACIVSCRANVQMALCNCTSHYIPHSRQGKVPQHIYSLIVEVPNFNFGDFFFMHQDFILHRLVKCGC